MTTCYITRQHNRSSHDYVTYSPMMMSSVNRWWCLLPHNDVINRYTMTSSIATWRRRHPLLRWPLQLPEWDVIYVYRSVKRGNHPSLLNIIPSFPTMTSMKLAIAAGLQGGLQNRLTLTNCSLWLVSLMSRSLGGASSSTYSNRSNQNLLVFHFKRLTLTTTASTACYF